MRDDILCVGTNLGTVWMFKSNDNSDFSVIGRFYAHDEAITYLDGCGSYMVTSSKKTTYIWSFQNDVQIIHNINVPG